jgi:prepilin-type processing-associated H-X9-DG protein
VESPIDTDNTGVFILNKTIRSREIEDGLSQTIFVGEKAPGGDELGWASGTRATLRNTGTPINQTTLNPGDLSAFADQSQAINAPTVPKDDTSQPPATQASPVGLSGPIPVGGFGSWHPFGSNFLFGDGSVHYLRANIDGRIYRLLGNRADGEPLGVDQF